jgi:hypothetical protein
MVSWRSFDDENAYDSGYDEYIQAAHRRPSSWTGTPCLSWHIAVWPEKNKDPQDKRKFPVYIEARSEWIARINMFIERLQRPPFQHEGSPILKFSFAEYPDEIDQKQEEESDEFDKSEDPHWTAIEPYAINFPMAWRGMSIWCVVTHSIDSVCYTHLTLPTKA